MSTSIYILIAQGYLFCYVDCLLLPHNYQIRSCEQKSPLTKICLVFVYYKP